jgi:glycosyl transferase, family 25
VRARAVEAGKEGLAMKLHLINLDRSADRLARFGEINGHVGDVERFAAIDGATVDVAPLVAGGIVEPGVRRFYSNGALGCALSHLALWERVIASGQSAAIVEDDAIFHRDFAAWSERLLGALPPDWEIVLWGWNYDSPLLFDMPGLATGMVLCDYENIRVRTPDFQGHPIVPTMVRLRQALGLVCYSLSPAGARKLRDFCLPIRFMKVPFRATKGGLMPNIGIDVMMSAQFPSLKAFACLPPLVVAHYDWAASTIRGGEARRGAG